MTKLAPVYFPDTAIFSETQYPLFLLLDSLHLLNPVEPAEDSEDNDIFAQQGLCQVHTPNPLGEDRARFVHLLKDIRHRKDDYASQLSSLTLAGMSAKDKSDSESRTAILSTLLGGKTLAATDDMPEEKIADLWQARLLLALGETYDIEEEDLASHLNFWDKQELELFAQLQGEGMLDEDNPINELLALQQKKIKANPTTMKKRCNAWFTLAKGGEFVNNPIWLTTREDGTDYLFDQFDRKTGKEPYICDMLAMPASIGSDLPSLFDSINEFKETNKELIEKISAAVTAALTTTGSSKPERPIIDPALESEWNKVIDEIYPEAHYGRKSLKIYFLSDFHPRQVIDTISDGANSGVLFLDN